MHLPKIRSISNSRWATYAAAGAATALTCANSAEAEIHYSGDVSVKLTGNARASLPLSNGASLFFENIDMGSTFWQDFDFAIKGVVSGSARAYETGFGGIFLTNLPSRVDVSAGRFLSVAGNPGFGVLISNWSDGQFAPNGGPNRGFVGFRFNTGNGPQYGWARISTKDLNTHQIHDVIKDYAWGDVGDPILTGQKQSQQPVTTNSIAGFLGLLAFGSQGFDAWRAQRTHESN